MNGKSEFVGSDEKAVENAIDYVLSTPTACSLFIAGSRHADSVRLAFTATGSIRGAKLMLAIVQKRAISQVRAGENRGRTLVHSQIVRDLHSLPISADQRSAADISLPHGFEPQGWEVIAFLQEKETGEIRAAQRVTIDGF